MHLIARNIDDVTCIQFVFIIPQPQKRTTMQDINTMFVRVLIKRGITTWLDSEIAHVEVGRILVGSNENLTGGTVGAAIFGSVGMYRDIIPAQFAIFHIVPAMYNAHVVLQSVSNTGSL